MRRTSEREMAEESCDCGRGNEARAWQDGIVLGFVLVDGLVGRGCRIERDISESPGVRVACESGGTSSVCPTRSLFRFE